VGHKIGGCEAAQTNNNTPETTALLCGSQNHHKIFRICQVCDRICDCRKFRANLPFVIDKKPPFAGISHFSLLQILILHRICGDRKSNRKLDICGRLREGFVSCTKGPLFLVIVRIEIPSSGRFGEIFVMLGAICHLSWRVNRGPRKLPHMYIQRIGDLRSQKWRV